MMIGMLLRYFSWGSFAAIFLLISPKLRMQVVDCLGSGVHSMDENAPYSYVGAALLIIVLFLYSLSRGAQPQ
jgi:hypothetical protein